VQVLGSFGDTVSHLPDCYSLYASYALVPDAEWSYLNCSPQWKSIPDPDISPSQASHLATCDPEREEPLFTPGANNVPQRCVAGTVI
jgi:hypothetical protein